MQCIMCKIDLKDLKWIKIKVVICLWTDQANHLPCVFQCIHTKILWTDGENVFCADTWYCCGGESFPCFVRTKGINSPKVQGTQLCESTEI